MCVCVWYRYDERMATEEVEKVEISKDDKFCDSHAVPIDAPLMLLDRFRCLFVCFYLTLLATAQVQVPCRSAFHVLMQQSRELHLPPVVDTLRLRGDQRVRNDLLKVLGELKIGWPPDIVNSAGEEFVRKLSATLWYLDCHHANFKNQGIKIPTLFLRFEGYNDYIAKKQKKPRLSKEGLNEHLRNLSALLCQPWFCRPRFVVLRENVEKLTEAVHSYVEYLDRHNQHVQSQHASPVPVRCADDFSDMRTITAVDGPVGEAYVELDKALSDLPLYKPVCLNDFCPDDCYQRKTWLTHLSLPYPIKEYRYAYGNQLGTVSFAWKISEPENETLLARVLQWSQGS